MSNDLISRAEVLMTLEKIFGEYRISWGSECGGFAAAVPNAIENIPTAYNIDKVVEQLEEDSKMALYEMNEPGIYAGLQVAIEDVKKGGTK